MDKALRKLCKIIVVDDSDFARRAMTDILDKEGYSVVGQAANAEEAIKYALTIPCHIFIVDIVMPQVSGLEFAKYLVDKKIGSSIIMTSSLNSDNIILESIKCGASDFLKKPFSKEELIGSVDKIANALVQDNILKPA